MTQGKNILLQQRGVIILLIILTGMTTFIRGFTAPRAQSSHCCRSFHSTTTRFLNRFLFDNPETNTKSTDSNSIIPTVILPKDDYRTIHAAKTLGLANGDKIRAGVVSCEEHSGLWTDDATVKWIPEGNVKKAEVLRNGNPPGSLSIELNDLKTSDASSDQILVSLILALPRP